MNLFKTFPLALTLALGVASAAASAATAPVTRVDGEPTLGAKAEVVVNWRAPAAATSRMVMRDLDLMRIAELQKRNRRDNVAVQIGIGRKLSEAATAMPALRWTKVAGGSVARLEVGSPDALGLRVGLAFDSIPAGAELRAAGSLAPDRIQLATGEQLRWQYRTAGTYWSPSTDGDRQTLELFVPEGTRTALVRMRVVEVSHLLSNSIERFSLAKAIGDSDFCEVDVICRTATLGANYVNTKNAVARMVFTVGGDSYTCTGTLLADTVTTTQIPYFWTADHCIDNATVAATLNTFWGFEATTCGSGIAAANTQRAGGADYLFSDNGATGTDAALLRLRDTPPAGAFFNGWNANVLNNGVGVLAVHHPQGDLKKSSLGSKVSQDTTLHEVGWTSATTEPGSSGSGLFTSTGTGGAYELRGGLYGGTASCANTGSIGNTQNRDYYSRLDVVYDDVKAWLAPTSTAPGPTRDYTGAWYVPTESGWGLTAFQYDNASKTLFVLFFIYDANGVAKWYELGGGWTANDVRSGQVMESNAGQPWSTTFNPSLRTFTPVGTATLTFSSATTANLSFTVNGVTRNVVVQKL